MLVERIWTGNAYRNYNYLIACPRPAKRWPSTRWTTKVPAAAAKVRGWQITQMLNTHEHHDHTGGNAAVVAATGAKVIAHHKAGGKIAGMDRGVQAGDIIKVGKTVELECLDTPGHTMCHICLRSHTDSRRCSRATRCSMPAPATATTAATRLLYATFADQLAKLPDNTQVYPGHDYIENNLKFTLDREPDNAAARTCCPGHGPRPGHLIVTTLARRSSSTPSSAWAAASVIAKLRERFPDLPEQPDARTVFVKLRELRNSW
jgi:hydroxyacylglutathione hydrolase